MKNLKKVFAVMLVLLVSFSLFAGGAKESASTTTTASDGKEPAQANKTLVIAVPATFEEKWNPFTAESAYDQQVLEQVFVTVTRPDRNNELVPYAGNVTYVLNPDGTVTYTVTLNEGMYFSDGEPVTIDDYIYTLYVLADPSNTSPINLVNYDIKGVEAYYYDTADYSEAVAGMEAEVAEKYAADVISKEDYIAYLIATDLEGWWDGNADPAYWADYAAGEGFADQLASIDQNDADQMLALIAEIEYTNYADSYDPYTYYLNKVEQDYISANLAGSQHVETISGIERIDDYTCQITYNSVDITAERTVGGVYIVPEHYYGDYEKGNVQGILSNMKPVGSGPYTFEGFADNIATLKANPNYFEGVPNIGYVRIQYVPDTDVLQAMANGEVDISNPTGTQQNIDEMNALGIEYDLIPFAGYGYAGFNCKTLDNNVRKGIFSLMNRESSVKGYYGDIANVIERPMLPTLAEYPHDATVYYPYSVENALAYFAAAGYTQKNGVLVNEEGEQLVVNAYIGGEGMGDHPAYAMLTGAAEDLASIGGELQINDVPFAVLQAAMNDGSADIWVMAWGNVTTPDKRDQFASTGGQNRYGIADPELDAIMNEIMQTLDLDERRELVSEMLDMAMDLAIELPIYQRNDIIAYNPMTVDMTSIPENSTGFWDYTQELWKVKML